MMASCFSIRPNIRAALQWRLWTGLGLSPSIPVRSKRRSAVGGALGERADQPAFFARFTG